MSAFHSLKNLVTLLLLGIASVSFAQTTQDRLDALKDNPNVNMEAGGPSDNPMEGMIMLTYIVEYDGTQSTMDRINDALGDNGYIKNRYQNIPYVAIGFNSTEDMEGSMGSLKELEGVMAIGPDALNRQSLTESHAQTQALLAQQKGSTGEGCGIAILDSGIDDRHCMFAGKLTHGSACFSTDAIFPSFQSVSTCPRIESSLTDPSLANSYEVVQFFPDHGTHVSGIAAGASCEVLNLNTNALETSPGGVASGAHIIPVNVFSFFPNFVNPVLSFTTDQIAGLDWLLSNKDALDLCVVNMSLGGGTPQATPCADGAREAVIDALTAAGVAVIIATGNGFSDTGVSSPACIESAIAVGAVDDAGVRAGFSNHLDAMVDLMAPGVNINSAISNFTTNPPPFSFTANFDGTSMATPTVAGAFAILMAEYPDATVAEVLEALQETGAPVPGLETPSIRILDACKYLEAIFIPTASEWALLILGMLLLIVGIVTIKSKSPVVG